MVRTARNLPFPPTRQLSKAFACFPPTSFVSLRSTYGCWIGLWRTGRHCRRCWTWMLMMLDPSRLDTIAGSWVYSSRLPRHGQPRYGDTEQLKKKLVSTAGFFSASHLQRPFLILEPCSWDPALEAKEPRIQPNQHNSTRAWPRRRVYWWCLLSYGSSCLKLGRLRA